MSNVLVIDDAQFSTEVLTVPQSVLVYFWAPWCGPCRLMSPIIETIASELGDRLKIVKMEVDPNPEAVSKCNVEGVPALVMFRDGDQLAALEGVQPKPKIQEFIASHLI